MEYSVQGGIKMRGRRLSQQEQEGQEGQKQQEININISTKKNKKNKKYKNKKDKKDKKRAGGRRAQPPTPPRSYPHTVLHQTGFSFAPGTSPPYVLCARPAPAASHRHRYEGKSFARTPTSSVSGLKFRAGAARRGRFDRSRAH